MLELSGLVNGYAHGRRVKGVDRERKAAPSGRPLQRIEIIKVLYHVLLVSNQVNSIFDQCQVIFVQEQLNLSNTTQILLTPYFLPVL